MSVVIRKCSLSDCSSHTYTHERILYFISLPILHMYMAIKMTAHLACIKNSNCIQDVHLSPNPKSINKLLHQFAYTNDQCTGYCQPRSLLQCEPIHKSQLIGMSHHISSTSWLNYFTGNRATLRLRYYTKATLFIVNTLQSTKY